MLQRLIEVSLQKPLYLLLGIALFIGAGVYSFQQLSIEAFPDVTDTQATVIALYPGHAAEEVEQQVTIPLEIALSGLPHSVRMNSHTQQGLSYIVITFDDAPSDYFVRQQVLEHMRDANLPSGVQPDLGPLTTAIGEVYRFRLRGDAYDSRQLRSIEDWTVEKYLRQVPGVADVVSIGGQIKQYVVTPNLGKIRDAHVSISQLYAALQRANNNAGGGAVEQGDQQFLLRSIGLLKGVADIEDTVISENNATPIRVKDVATVAIGSEQRQGVVGMGYDDDAVIGIIDMRKGENPTVVLNAVKDKINQLNTKILPKGVQIQSYYDRSWLIQRTLGTVFRNLLEGALLVTLVLYIFLSDLRAAMAVATVIPLALLATFLGLHLLGMPANLLSLGAMDFGILVDGAVIVVENIFQRLTRAGADKSLVPRGKIVMSATAEVGRPTLFAMIIIIAAYIPIFTLQRQEGRLFSPMAYSVCAALIGALLVSLTLVPLLCLLFLPKELPHEENRLVRWCKRHYAPIVSWSISHTRTVIIGAVSALAVAILIATQLGSEFIPALNEGDIWVNISLPPSISVRQAQSESRRIRMALMSVPEVKTVVSKAGRPEDGTDPKNLNSVEVAVSLKEESLWRKGMSRELIIQDMDSAVRKLPGLDPSFDGPIYDNVLESISQVDGQIVIKLFGESLDVLNQVGHQILTQIRAVKGVAQASIDREGMLPQFILEVDRSAAGRFGLNVADIQDLVESSIGGRPATELYEGEQHYSVVVRLEEEERTIGALSNTLIATADGAHIPLSEVVHVRTTSGAMDISRQDSSRLLSIGVFIKDRDMGSVVKDMQDIVDKNVKIPSGYEVKWSGEFENQQRAMRRLAIVVPISILIIFLLLFNAFGSLKNAGLIVANIPFALIGGIVALWLTGLPLSVSAAIGFIALFGQAVLNGVVMVSYFDQLRERGVSIIEAVKIGTQDRLRTAMMTTMLAMLGLLPMALSHDIGSETQRPLAIVVIGGLISATMLTLVVLPVLYVRFSKESDSD